MRAAGTPRLLLEHVQNRNQEGPRAMVQSQLNTYSGSDPVWGFVALVRSEKFTGEAAVGLDPRVRLFAVDGHIYFAEREDDAAITTRLVKCGAISAMQLARGSVRTGGSESLARMFQRDPTIDRDAVELTVASSTEALLATIANTPVGMPEVFPLRYHPSGIHHWLHRDESPVVEDETSPVAQDDGVEIVTKVAPVVEAITVEPTVETPTPATPVVLAPQQITMPTLAPQPEPAVTPPSTSLAPPQPPEQLEPPRLGQPVLPAPPTGAGLPLLAAIHGNDAPSAPQPPNEPIAQPEFVIDSAALPKLAAAPVSVRDLKMAAATSEAWSSTSKNMAAVQIWNMVDELVDDNQLDSPRVGISAAPAPRTGWRRRKS